MQCTCNFGGSPCVGFLSCLEHNEDVCNNPRFGAFWPLHGEFHHCLSRSGMRLGKDCLFVQLAMEVDNDIQYFSRPHLLVADAARPLEEVLSLKRTSSKYNCIFLIVLYNDSEYY